MNYKRVLLKLSGESLMGEKGFGIEADHINAFAKQIKEITAHDIELGIVIGGGNIFRGLAGTNAGVDRVKGDQMGMLATVINSLALQSGLENMGVKVSVYTSIRMEPFADYYIREKVQENFKEGAVNIIAAGTGNPYFTTDSAAALRALELDADVLIKGTRVGGVFSADPEKDKSAVKYDDITFNEAIEKRLNVMDMTAFALCRDNNLPIVVFDITKPGNLEKVILGQNIGTLVH